MLFHSLCNQLIHIIHNHNTVIYDNTGQHDKTDDRNDTDLTVPKEQSQEATRKCQRNRKHNDKRRFQGLELGNHNQIHENNRQKQHQHQLLHGIHNHLIFPLHHKRIPLRYFIICKVLFQLPGYQTHVISVCNGSRYCNIAVLFCSAY